MALTPPLSRTSPPGGPHPGRTPGRPSRPTRRGSGFRGDLQALRAVAVALVVVYHLWPRLLPGGYLGVDVFFVLSGFLITTHLLAEVRSSGRIAVTAFWARRARRLLPASLLVLLATAGATLALVPQVSWQPFLREVGASALYVENWSLAAGAVDYLAESPSAVPTQHYWSLSAEEQFYLVWPLLVTGAAWSAVRRGGRGRSDDATWTRWTPPLLAVALGGVTAASFAWSLHQTAASPSSAYFVTTTRAWEFGAGGLLALAGTRPRSRSDRLGGAVAWAGLAALAAGALTFSAATRFPGTAALLPVLGALAVIWADEPRGAGTPALLNRLRPVRWLGDVSYAVYLWHWPLVVLLPYALGHPLGTGDRVAVLGASLVAAQLTKLAVEDPVRRARALAARPPRVTFAAVAAATALVVAVCGSGWGVVQVHVSQSRDATSADPWTTPCFGAGALDPAQRCSSPHSATAAVDTAFAANDRSHGMTCLAKAGTTELHSCRTGPAHPTRTVALVGDSHAASWYEALAAVADRQGWALVTYVEAACPALGTDRLTGLKEPAACLTWSRSALRAVADDPSISEVFTSYRDDLYRYVGDDRQLSDTIPVDLLQAPLRQLSAAGKTVHVLRDVPGTGAPGHAVAVPNCIAAAGSRTDPCATDRSAALHRDQLADAARALDDPQVDVLDLTDRFCDAQRCHAYTGGVVVYFDDTHLTATYSHSLAAALQQRLRAAG